MKSLAFAAGIAALTATPAFADEERTYDLPDFDRIDISAGIMLVADVGGAQSVTVTTEKGDFDDIDVIVRNGELKVSREWNRLSWHGGKSDYKVTVTAPSLIGLDASSGAHARITNINAPRFAVGLSSGAHAELAGNCAECVLDLSSGAHLFAKEMECENARIDVSSGGQLKIVVTDSVVADASSGGYAAIYGNPERVDVDRSSGGRVKIVSDTQLSRN